MLLNSLSLVDYVGQSNKRKKGGAARKEWCGVTFMDLFWDSDRGDGDGPVIVSYVGDVKIGMSPLELI